MLEAPGRLLPRPMSLCLAPRGELAFLIDPIGPGTARALRGSSRATSSHVLGPLGNGFRPGRRAAAARRRRHRHRAAAVSRPKRSDGRRRCSASAVEWHAEAAALVPNAEVASSPTLVTELIPTGMRRARVRARADARGRRASSAPDAQLAWEAPMACGYGACYGCAVEIDGELEAPLRRRTGALLLLNASGCLDALTAPDVARALDAFVTKTVTPLPREGNAPVRIAETDVGMLNSIGLANPGIDRFLPRNLPRLARARRAGLGFGRRVRGATTTPRSARGSTTTPRSARSSSTCRARTSTSAGGDARREIVAACRAATASRSRRSFRPQSRTSREVARAVAGGRCRRPLAREHDPRPDARRAHASTGARRGPRAVCPARAEADRARGRRRLATARRSCRSSAWAASSPVATRSSSIAAGARHVALGTILFADPDAPARVRAELHAAAAERGWRTYEDAYAVAHEERCRRDNSRQSSYKSQKTCSEP